MGNYLVAPFVSRAGGNWSTRVPLPADLRASLSNEAWGLVESSFADLEGDERVTDYHTHLGGVGTGRSGCCVHPNSKASFRHPVHNFTYRTFLAAGGVVDESRADEQYLERLVALIESIQKNGFPWGRHALLALDAWHDEDGTRRMDRTGMYVPNSYVLEVCERYPHCFTPCASIHPYREDAIAELEACYERGVRMIKWLPNSQGMDPSNPKCRRFYDALVRLDVALLTHTGEEHAVAMGGPDQSLGNPLLLRFPLEIGVRVIAAHCASEGTSVDLDAPKAENDPLPRVENYLLLARLMAQYPTLHADISAMIGFRRVGEPLSFFIRNDRFHSRLLYGSDYLVPAINMVVHLSKLVREGHLIPEQVRPLREIYSANPLLFDYVVKRLARASPLEPIPSDFESRPAFPKSAFLARPDVVRTLPRSEESPAGVDLARSTPNNVLE